VADIRKQSNETFQFSENQKISSPAVQVKGKGKIGPVLN
jgi:hypothetical protein